MRFLRRFLLIFVIVAAVAAAWLYQGLTSHPDVARYAGLAIPAATAQAKALRVTFLGVSTLLLDDGDTAILTDGFFTRPNPSQLLLGKISPDKNLIAKYLRRAGVSRLAAVIVNHSHYDHAMDSPEVAMQTGALLVGSPSTANVGRGWGLPEDRIRIIRPGDVLEFGRFRVTALPSRHIPSGVALGEITGPLTPPVRATAYREGGSFCFRIEHDGRSLLINASAGYQEGALEGVRADVVFLGIGQLGHQSQVYRDAYWREIVQSVKARRVIPIHWDNFALPLDQPLQPIPQLFDDFDTSMRFLQDRAAEERIDVRLPVAWQAIDPFAGLQ